jgi:hypothetical protein
MSLRLEKAVAQPEAWRGLHNYFSISALGSYGMPAYRGAQDPAVSVCRQTGLQMSWRRCKPLNPQHAALPQVDGEPWLQPAAQIEVDFRGTALMLRRLESAPLARMAAGVTEALEACQARKPCSTDIRLLVIRQTRCLVSREVALVNWPLHSSGHSHAMSCVLPFFCIHLCMCLLRRRASSRRRSGTP